MKKEGKGKAQKKKEAVFVFSAHSDDFVIGAGGTIAKYAREGKKVISIVFSFGEKSHPWLKEKVIQKMRSEEAWEASKILKCKTVFFDLKEFNFINDYLSKNIEAEILKLLEKEKPIKIFTHSSDDPHPDHQAVHKITTGLYQKISYNPKPELYIYSIWNPLSLKTQYPALYVDVQDTFSLKLQALKTFRSQKIHIAYPFILLLFKTILAGWKLRKKYGEKFYRIK